MSVSIETANPGLENYFDQQNQVIDQLLTEAQLSADREKIVLLNPGEDPQILFKPRMWSLEEFAKPNHPIDIGEISNATEFGKQAGVRVLDMPVRIPGQGWRIAPEFEQFVPVIAQAAHAERLVNAHYDDYFCYVTIDQKPAEPSKSQRRVGWHTDAFVTDSTGMQIDVVPENADQLGYLQGEEGDRTYVAANVLPTLFLEGPFDLGTTETMHDNASSTFDAIAGERQATEGAVNTLLRLDPFTVHSAQPNTTNQTLDRTFIKIAFSKYKYNREGNTHNDHLDYSWGMVPRTQGEREHRTVVLGHELSELNDKYKPVDPTVLFEATANMTTIPWIEPQFVKAQKIEKVSAVPAEDGQKVETRVHGELISLNIAPKNSWVITNSVGEQYCLTGKQFEKFYNIDEKDSEGKYLPKAHPKTMVRVSQDVRLYGPWGGMQYVPRGSMLVIDDKYDVYAIHPSDFARAYEVQDSEYLKS